RLRAESMLVQGRIDDAEELYRSVLASDPKDFRSLIGLGRISRARGRNEEAARLYTNAKNLRPMDPRARLGLAASKDGLGKLPEAITELEGVEPRARTLSLVLVLAEYYLRSRREVDAVRLLTPVVEAYPRSPQPRFVLGLAYLARGNVSEAVGEFEELH